ncbi:unnamed protein product [Parnassius apollo]|uniref:(apollo) hypothetical protein n=1 Tax=Parnassius apollo TaxID=110799 RepID=A0A8S3W250_PARAO|nr:unnamed protein product [Parnassius apollo]
MFQEASPPKEQMLATSVGIPLVLAPKMETRFPILFQVLLPTLDTKDWRIGNKGRLKLCAPRKKKLKRTLRGWFMNKENIPPVLDTSQPSPRESFKQVVVQAQVHETTLRQDKALRWKNILLENDPCDQTGPGEISTQTDWDIIESDVDFARYTPISATQEESISTTQEYNKSSASEPDSDKYNFSFETDNCDNSDCANLEGNRIVNIAYLFQQLKNIRHDPFECNFQHLEFIRENRIAFYSQFVFKCKFCNKIEKIESQQSNKESKDIPINLNVIEGISQTGNGWSQLDELC